MKNNATETRDQAEFSIRQWGREIVVFDGQSGNSHLIVDAAATHFISLLKRHSSQVAATPNHCLDQIATEECKISLDNIRNALDTLHRTRISKRGAL